MRRSIPAVTEQPLTFKALLPYEVNLRDRMSVSSVSMSNSSRRGATHPASKNSARTMQKFSPERIMLLSALAPSTKSMASRMTDLPAPVSPESTLTPAEKTISARVTSATF